MEQNRNQEQGREQQANTPDRNRQQQSGSGRSNEENMEYVNDPDPALTERDLQENNLSVEEADQVEWDKPERNQEK